MSKDGDLRRTRDIPERVLSEIALALILTTPWRRITGEQGTRLPSSSRLPDLSTI